MDRLMWTPPRTLTERFAKRLRRGQPIPASSVPPETTLRWAENYAVCRSFHCLPRWCYEK